VGALTAVITADPVLWSSWWRCCLGHCKNTCDDDDDDDDDAHFCSRMNAARLIALISVLTKLVIQYRCM